MIRDEKQMTTIGLILEDAFTDYAKDIAHSVAHSIMGRKDLRLIMVAGRQDNGKDPADPVHRYRSMYNAIYSMNARIKFDGLLFTFPNMIGVSEDLFGDIPKVYIAAEKEDELTVNYDNEMGIREALDFLVRIKGFTKICMLGGRDDNGDAQKRKACFCNYLAEAGLPYTESQYEKTDMSTNTHEAASRLLSRNPDVQAVFCVNDPAAVGLYDVMRSHGKIPGKDIYVFGFDNAAMAAQMVPPLASIGTDGVTVGQKALELLLDKISGQDVSSAVVPTRLFGRDSFEYETYEITTRDILKVDSSFIYNFFDDCFYRYGNEVVDAGDIDFKRLFYEILSRMMSAIKNRYMDEKQFGKIMRLIDIFFENGAMRYTDANKFVRSISRLQGSMNETFRGIRANSYNNRLFSYMKDKAIQAQAFAKSMETKGYHDGRNRNFDYMINTVNYGFTKEQALENLISHFDETGFGKAALYLFDKPVSYRGSEDDVIPDTISLKCVLKDGALFVIPKERSECRLGEIFTRSEIPYSVMGYTSYPLFYGNYLFGILVSDINRSMMDTGEYLSFQLGRALYTNLMIRV
ncbi:MAG: LacI family DNA-binding transcriptional regulator [Lachnospiraceae bacterium]|nr:LacI family DNA-binding transcriptional regulator [Lachnospiraceae bacterium]